MHDLLTRPADAAHTACHEGEHDHPDTRPSDPLAHLRQGDPFDLDGRIFYPIAKGPNRIAIIGACEVCSFPFMIDGLPDLIRKKTLPKRCPRHRRIERAAEMSADDRDAIAHLLDGRISGKSWQSQHHDIPSIKHRANRVSAGDFRVIGKHGYFLRSENMRERPRDGAVTRHFDVVAACATCRQLFTFVATTGHLHRRGGLPVRCPDHSHIRRASRPVRWTPELLIAAREFGR